MKFVLSPGFNKYLFLKIKRASDWWNVWIVFRIRTILKIYLDVFCLTYLLGFRQRRNQLQQFAIRLNIIESKAKMNGIKWSSNFVAQPSPGLT